MSPAARVVAVQQLVAVPAASAAVLVCLKEYLSNYYFIDVE